MKTLYTSIALLAVLCMTARDLAAAPDLDYEEWYRRYRSYLGATGVTCKDPTLSLMAGTVGHALSRYAPSAGSALGAFAGSGWAAFGLASGWAASSLGDALQEWDGWVCYCTRVEWRTDIYWTNEAGEFTGEVTSIVFREPCCFRLTISTLGGRGEKCYAPAPNERACMEVDFGISSGGSNAYWCPR